MILDLCLRLLVPGLIGAALSFWLEHLLLPRPVPVWRRPGASHMIHAGLWLALYALELALFRRPVFAVLNVLALQLLVILVSNVKYSTLREPFVYTDFEYFIDAIRHPRLYLPFFGRIRAALAAAGYAAVLLAGLTLEDALTGAGGVWLLVMDDAIEGPVTMLALAAFWAAMAVLVLMGWALIKIGVRQSSVAPSFDASADLRRLGLAAALACYRASERAPISVPEKIWLPLPTASGGKPGDTVRPDIVVVQSESFFDARRIFPEIKADVLSRFDFLQSRSEQAGRLRVAAWGANTVRTEFAFLSGLAPQVLGVHRYNPYRRLARQHLVTLAEYLRQLGYHTVCIHPYPSSFYCRSTVYPIMGFETFIDIEAFTEEERFGPYISDAAVARKIEAVLEHTRDARPVFVFAITMENHGPLHWETVGPDDRTRFFETAPPAKLDDLVAYVRHLANADAMFGRLAETLSQHARPSTLCIYGDHVPIMPAVYAARAEPDGLTDYVIWRPEGQGADRSPNSAQLDIVVENLADRVLRAAFEPAGRETCP